MVNLDKFQKDIIKAAKEFAKGEFEPEAALEYDGEGVFPHEVINKAKELGFIGIHFSEQYTGAGLTYFEEVILSEALTQVDSTFGISIMYSVVGAEPIFLFGSEEQKSEFLPKVIEGDEIICHALGNNYDFILGANSPCIRVESIQDGAFILNGELSNVINGPCADWLIFCIHGSQIHRDEDFCIFLVPLDMDGIEIEPRVKGLGWSMCPRANIVFNNVELDKTYFLRNGYIGKKELMRFWASEMIIIAGLCLGIAKGSLDRALDYVNFREQFNKKLMDFPVTREKISEMLIKVLQARLITYNAAKALSNTTRKTSWKKLSKIVSQVSMAKVSSARAAKEVSDQSIQLLGGYGYMREYHVERFYRDAKCCELLGGNIHANRELIIQNAV